MKYLIAGLICLVVVGIVMTHPMEDREGLVLPVIEYKIPNMLGFPKPEPLTTEWVNCIKNKDMTVKDGKDLTMWLYTPVCEIELMGMSDGSVEWRKVK